MAKKSKSAKRETAHAPSPRLSSTYFPSSGADSLTLKAICKCRRPSVPTTPGWFPMHSTLDWALDDTDASRRQPRWFNPTTPQDSERAAFQFQQAAIIVIFQILALLVGVLMYWNYVLIQPYVTPIFWALVWSIVLHPSKARVCKWLHSIDRRLDALADMRQNFIQRVCWRSINLVRLLRRDAWWLLTGPSVDARGRPRSGSLRGAFKRKVQAARALFAGLPRHLRSPVTVALGTLITAVLLLQTSELPLLQFSLRTMVGVTALFAVAVFLLVAVFVLLPPWRSYDGLVASVFVCGLASASVLGTGVVLVKLGEEGWRGIELVRQIAEDNSDQLSELFGKLQLNVDDLREWQSAQALVHALRNHTAIQGKDWKDWDLSQLNWGALFDDHGVHSTVKKNNTATAAVAKQPRLHFNESGDLHPNSTSNSTLGMVPAWLLNTTLSSISFSSVTTGVAWARDLSQYFLQFASALSLHVFTTFSYIVSGGIRVLDFIVDLVVFCGSLYVLLQSRENVIVMSTSLIPVSSYIVFLCHVWIPSLCFRGAVKQRFLRPLVQSVQSIFAMNFMLSVTHGLTTWLCYAAFGIDFKFISGFISALFAVIPYFSSWWCCVPACIWLILARGDLFAVTVIMSAHVFVLYFVDPIIHSRVRLTHPYLTGMSIICGLYTLGLQGAIVGPLLCCLTTTTMSAWRHWMQSDHDVACSPQHRSQSTPMELVKRRARTPAGSVLASPTPTESSHDNVEIE